jgi:ribosomal protein S12 methylthiotransferase accessory factor
MPDRNIPDAIVYLGPSMTLQDARNILRADFRKPVRRGDLDGVESGSVVALIDGVFEQNLAVSVQEVQQAVSRGVTVFGGGSMGALRAAEVPGVIGVGRVFDWYRQGVINRDDEVALLFVEDTGLSVTVPTVNVRFAVERLRQMGTIDVATGEELIAAALRTPYKERTYQAVLDAAGLSKKTDSSDLIAMLEVHDIKRRDAQSVLEAVDRHVQTLDSHRCETICPTEQVENSFSGPTKLEPAVKTGPRTDEILIWESGDRVSHEDLTEFLAYTGQLEQHALSLGVRLADFPATDEIDSPEDVQKVFRAAVCRWGWMSSEETHITMTDLGLDLELVNTACRKRTETIEAAASLIAGAPQEFRRALLGDLFLDGLMLKREAMRLGSLRQIANQSNREPAQKDILEAQAVLSKVNGEFSFSSTCQRWAALGFDDPGRRDAFLRVVARARHVARRIVASIKRGTVAPIVPPNISQSIDGPCPKPPTEARFSLPLEEAERHARRIATVIGVTRIGMIGELGDFSGIQIAQAARPGNSWSSSYGSGKATSVSGAVVGSVMEETEKWAQEEFRPCGELLRGSYQDLRERKNFLDPAQLDLPYDSVYHADMQLEWYPCHDLIGNDCVYVPVDVLDMRRRKHDICFTARGGRKHLATNGLGCGFRREEAILHGLCEYVERHAQRIAEILLSNPCELAPHPYRFVDLETASASVQYLARQLSNGSATVRVLDVTPEIRIPSFLATIMRDWRRADGFGTHPNPNVAIEMALLEAAQTIAGSAAGGREDLSIQARSLGRHERPRPASAADAWFWMDTDSIQKPVSDVIGFLSNDISCELMWCLERLRSANVDHALVVDLTKPSIEPASVVRVILPGLETNNPFYTGTRARLLLLNDLLPRWQ